MKQLFWEITSDLRTSVCHRGFCWWRSGKESVYQARNVDSVLGLERSLGEGKATHCSTPVWEILWIQEPGRLRSMASQRAGHD